MEPRVFRTTPPTLSSSAQQLLSYPSKRLSPRDNPTLSFSLDCHAPNTNIALNLPNQIKLFTLHPEWPFIMRKNTMSLV